MIKIAIIIGSTRPGRLGVQVGRWVYDEASKRNDAQYDLIDVADYNLPLLDEKNPPAAGKYEKDHTKAWAKKIAAYDGFIFVTAEYNHSIPAALKNALDFLYYEWNNKAAAFVGYGSSGGTRAVEHLRQVMAELQIADVRAHIELYLAADFEDYRILNPDPEQKDELDEMFNQVVAWSGAMRRLRQEN